MYRNLTDALIGSLRLLLTEGATVPSRNGETKELYCHHIRLSNPTERVLISPHRGANIFAQLAETMWVMGGRDDVEFLSRYLPRAKDFSDDGKVWRGGYGPRIRKWTQATGNHSELRPQGETRWVQETQVVDQLAECVNILKEDLPSRRAVIVIFDPAKDFVQSKDIPCNNWLHFLVRDGKLNLTVGIRSNDAIWGFSGINVFEWSVLQQMVAHWIGVEVGVMAYTASSFHLYDYHYEKAEKMVADAKTKTLYDFGVPQLKFETAFEDFDAAMAEFFNIEKDIQDRTPLTTAVKDPLLNGILRMLQIYRAVLDKDDIEEVCWLLNDMMPASDLRVGAVMWLRQHPDFKGSGFMEILKLSEEERAFIDWYTKPVSTDVTLEEIHETLKVLHYKKTLSYGDSWRKHGEILGVFSNITRKRDRILALAKGAKGTSDEGMMDTVADLCVYASKYMTLLAELFPVAFAEYLGEVIDGQTFVVDSDYYTGLEGFDRVLDMLLQQPEAVEFSEAAHSLFGYLDMVMESYTVLEEVLTASERTENGRIVIPAAANMGICCALAIQALAKGQPNTWAAYVETVEKL